MWWTDPLWLLAAALTIPLIWLSRGLERRRSRPGTYLPAAGGNVPLRRMTWWRTLAASLVILALAGTSVLLPSHRRCLAVLLDVSESVDRGQIELARQSIVRLIGRLDANDRVAAVAFAGRPRLLTPLVTPNEAAALMNVADLSAPRPDQTDLRLALLTARELLGRNRGNQSILLFSDGRPTVGGRVGASLAETGNIPVYAIPVGRPGAGLICRGLVLPELVHPGERALAQWKVENDREQTVTVSVRLDGQVVSRQTLQIPAGQSVVQLPFTAQEPGVHRFGVETTGADGQPMAQAAWGGLLHVSGPARVLVVHADAGSSPIARALSNQGMEIRERGAEGLPETASGLVANAAVVLDNVPAFYMAESQRKALLSYVAGGGGLLVVGGESSLGRGEYYDTELEELLPVQTDTRQRLRFTRASILFVLDHSGSMAEIVGGTSKQLAAMRGIASAIKELSPQDEVGVLSFDTEPTWVLPFTPVTKRAEIQSALSHVAEGGGTDMSTALQEATQGFSTRGPGQRHVVILSDGLTQGSNFAELCRQLRGLGATITTIAVGEQINESLLRSIARWGEGQYYRAELDQIPRVILRETIRITRDLIQEGRFAPAVKMPADLLSGLEHGMPPVLGYLVTKPKSLASVYLTIGKGDPLLAGWRYGNGRVAVFTSDSGRRWLAPWVGSASYNRLWSQVVRSIERGTAEVGLRTAVHIEAGTARLLVEAIGPDYRLRSGLQLLGRTGNDPGASFPLTETAPGRYEASVPSVGGGLQEFEVYERLGDGWAVGGIWNPPGGELQALGPDQALLAYLCGATGGRVLSIATPEPPAPGWTWTPTPLRGVLILLALALFLLELGYRSTSLGQFKMARAALEVWWQAQAHLIDLARGISRSAPGALVHEGKQRAMEAHRYLAERIRGVRDEERKRNQ